MTNDTSSPASELGLIPTWAKVLAALVALAVAVGLPLALAGEPDSPPVWVRAIIVIAASSILAGLILLVGYVNRDAGRRGMSRLIWTLVVIVVPNALGFVVYFLVRRPILAPCPGCGWAVRPDFNFCPRCNQRLTSTCPKCERAIEPGGQFCVQCGTKLQATAAGDITAAS